MYVILVDSVWQHLKLFLCSQKNETPKTQLWTTDWFLLFSFKKWLDTKEFIKHFRIFFPFPMLYVFCVWGVCVVHAYMCECVQCMCGSEEDIGCPPLSFPYHREVRSLHWKVAVSTEWTGGPVRSQGPTDSTLQCWGYRRAQLCSALCECCGVEFRILCL